MKLKLKLIVPTWENKQKRKLKGMGFRWPPLNLPIIAALTPKDFDISIVDENVDNIDWDDVPDIVGITCMTAQAPRAYAIAKRYREMGVKVVMGGMHPSALPDESLQYANAVIIGEAELVWEKLLYDFKQGNLQKIYKSNKYPNLINMPLPRRDLLKLDRYIIFNTIQLFRGCPYNCSFCSVTRFFGNTYRARPIDDVIREINILRGTKLRSKIFAFVDDNIVGLPEYTKELCRKLIPLKIWWGGQASIRVAEDVELVKLLAQSGCRALFIGFESVSQETLKEAHKSFVKVSKFVDAVKRLHDYGINVEGAFIFGFDSDDKSVFYRTVEFADKMGVDAAQFGILTPFPGTTLWEKLEREGRILIKDWSKYTIGKVVFKPKNMTPEELQEGTNWAWDTFYSLRKISKRLIRALKRPGTILPVSLIQYSYRRHISCARKAEKSKSTEFIENFCD